MLEVKVRAAELLPAGQDAQLAKLTASRSPRCASRRTRSSARCSSARPARTSSRKTSRPRSRPGGPTSIAPNESTAVTPEEQQEVRRLIDAHEHTLQVCRACAETDARPGVGSEARQRAVGRVAGRDAGRSRARARRPRQGRSRDRRDEGGALVSDAPSADRLGELVNFSVDAIVLVNADGVIQWANPATPDVLGYRAGRPRRRARPRPGRARRSRRVAGAGRRAVRRSGDAGSRHVPLPPQGRIGALDRGRRAQPAAGAARRRHRRLLPRRHARKATEAAAEGQRRSLRPPVSSAADVIFEADAEGYFRFVNPQTLQRVRVRAGRGDRPPLHRVHSRRLPPADPPALLPADHRGPAELVRRVSGDHQVGQGSLARPERVDHHRRRRHSSSACRRWRATSPSGARRRGAARRRGEVPRPRRAVADGRLHPAERAAGLRQPEGAPTLLGYTQQELLDWPSPFAFVHEQDRAARQRSAGAPRSRAHAERAAHDARRRARTARSSRSRRSARSPSSAASARSSPPCTTSAIA